ncbi:hypothetical protein phi9181_ORF082 [Enterococcus phage 9181]|nr:hypothetical protein phi9181_ORF082 [Enterococcus phage 9181]
MVIDSFPAAMVRYIHSYERGIWNVQNSYLY